MSTNPATFAFCPCGQVTLQAVGAPMLSVACYCESCRSAAREFEQAPGAPAVFNRTGGVDYCLYRKDRVTMVRGKELLREHRLTQVTRTRRMVASCCNAPMFLDFTKGHWLTLYRERLPKDSPLPEMAVMTRDFPAGRLGPDSPPIYPTRPAKFMIRLLSSWAAMGFARSRNSP